MKKVLISPFKPAWWAFWGVIVVCIAGLTWLLKEQDVQTQRIFLLVMAVASIGYFVFYKYLLYSDETFEFHWQDELPFQLCNLATVFCLVGVLTNNAFLLGYCCCIAPFGAIVAVCMPYYRFLNVEVFSKKSIGFYGHHGFIIVNGILILTLDMYTPQASYTLPMALFVAFLLCCAYGLNVWIRHKCHTYPNYMFTYQTDHNPVLEWLYQRIPYRLLYTFPLLILVIILHSLLVLLAK